MVWMESRSFYFRDIAVKTPIIMDEYILSLDRVKTTEP